MTNYWNTTQKKRKFPRSFQPSSHLLIFHNFKNSKERFIHTFVSISRRKAKISHKRDSFFAIFCWCVTSCLQHNGPAINHSDFFIRFQKERNTKEETTIQMNLMKKSYFCFVVSLLTLLTLNNLGVFMYPEYFFPLVRRLLVGNLGQ